MISSEGSAQVSQEILFEEAPVQPPPNKPGRFDEIYAFVEKFLRENNISQDGDILLGVQLARVPKVDKPTPRQISIFIYRGIALK